MNKRVLLGAGLALPLAGLAVPALASQPGGCPAAQPEGLTAFQPAAIELRAEHMLATADAMFREMNAEMNAMQAQMAALMQAPIPGPQQLTEATFGPGYSVPPGTAGATVISITTVGNGRCSDTRATRTARWFMWLNAGMRAVRSTWTDPEHGPQLIEAYYQPALPHGWPGPAAGSRPLQLLRPAM